jgi:hypothetical protein
MCVENATSGTAPAGGMGDAEQQHGRNHQPDGDGRDPPCRGRHGEDRHTDRRRHQVAAENIGRLGQGALGLAEQQHRSRAERRQQHRQSRPGSQPTHQGHGNNGAEPGLQVRQGLAARLVPVDEIEKAAQLRKTRQENAARFKRSSLLNSRA